MTEWLRPHESGALLLLSIQQRGISLFGISGIHNNRLRVKREAPPREGEANYALIEFFSDFLRIPKKKIHLLRGESSQWRRFYFILRAEFNSF